MTRVLLTILGLRPTRAGYVLSDQRETASLAPVALFHLLPVQERPDIVVALCTEEARKASFPELEGALSSSNVKVCAVPIELRGEPQDIDHFLTVMVDTCEKYEGASLIVDVTHGFRHLSFLMYVGALYLSALKRVTVSRIYYALLNGLPQPSPFFDLTPLLKLPEWIHAVRTLRETGSAQMIGRLVCDRSTDIAIEIDKMMRRISDAHAAGLPIELGKEIDQFISQRMNPFRRLLREEKLPLSERVVQQLKDVIEPYRLSSSGPNSECKRNLVLDEQELERQAQLVDELLERRNLPAAMGLMHEWTISWVLWNRENSADWLDFQKSRRKGAGQIGALAAAKKDGQPKRLLTPEQLELAEFWKDLSDLRNALHHHGMRPQYLLGDDFDAKRRKVEMYWKKHLRPMPRFCFDFGAMHHQRLLVSPIGDRPGVLYSAVKRVAADGGQPDLCLIVCSEKSEPSVEKALCEAGFQGEVRLLRLEDPYAGIDERKSLLQQARQELAVADEVLVNITGGTTLMGVVTEDLANEARKLGRSVRRFALIDKRTPEQQKLNPFVEGDILWLDEKES